MIKTDRFATLQGNAPEAPAPNGVRPRADLRRVDVDVRPEIASGVEPFAKIMTAVQRLAADEALVLHVPFEPVPLYAVLGKRGFAHWVETQTTNDWTIWFFLTERGDPEMAPVPQAKGADAPLGTPPADVRRPPAKLSSGSSAPASHVLDVRGLEPPAPLVAVMQELDILGPDDELVVVHDRRPLFLYPQLEDRGFAHRTDEPEPGVIHITIRRPSAT